VSWNCVAEKMVAVRVAALGGDKLTDMLLEKPVPVTVMV
jgi:hypothetical protein